jgi:hypothetical protein
MAIIILQKRLATSIVADSINKNRPREKGQMKEESVSIFYTIRPLIQKQPHIISDALFCAVKGTASVLWLPTFYIVVTNWMNMMD